MSGVSRTPSFSQIKVGIGIPAAVQLSTASLPSGIIMLRKCSIKYGGLKESLSNLKVLIKLRKSLSNYKANIFIPTTFNSTLNDASPTLFVATHE